MSAEIDRARAAEPRWDEVRERRVLGRVIGARDALLERRDRRRRGVVVATLAVAATLLLVLGAQWWSSDGERVARPGASPAPAPAPVDRDRTGRLALADGSEIEPTEGARVEIEHESPTEVILSQQGGAALYVVSHVPDRRFVVRCSGVEVEVRGTRFWVRHEPELVEVDVEEGRVAVRRGASESVLGAGESLRVRLTEELEVGEAALPVPPTPAPVPARDRVTPSREPTPTPSLAASAAVSPPARDVSALLDAAEQARREHRFDDAVAALEEALRQLRGDRRAATAYFTLGRLERTRARHAAAAAAFESAYDADPDAILAEDALAESIVSWSVAGRLDRARTLGRSYLERYPAGSYLARVRAAIGD